MKLKLWLLDIYDYIFSILPERISRSYAYAKFGWLNYDFDYAFAEELLLFKLKRMQYTFIKYGHHCPTCVNYKPKFKSLALTIKLLDRYLNDYDYYRKNINNYEKKNGYRLVGLSPQQHKDFIEAYNKDQARKQRDINLVYKIIAKHKNRWWD